jgi:signal recognition particle subunit SRP19
MKGACILYPCYFNASLKRQQGRKVPLSKATKNPTLVDLENSLKKNGLKFHAEQKHHPGHWARHEGRMVVTWDKSKQELLKIVCSKLEIRK